MLWFAFGDRVTRAALSALLLVPLLLGVTALGLRAGTWLGKDRLRRLTMAMLLVVGAIGVLAPIFR